MANPSVRSVGTTSGGATTTPLSISTPAGFQSGDLLVAVFEYSTGATTNHVTATGWTETAWRDQVAATGRTDLAVMTRISDGSEGTSVSFALAGTINHWSGRMLAVQSHGLATVSNIVVGTITGGAASGSNPQTCSGLGDVTVSGTNGDPLIMMFGGTALDANSTAQFSAYQTTNLGTGSWTEHMDNVVLTGNGGGFGCASAVLTGGGSTGAGTSGSFQEATNEAWNGVIIGIVAAAPAAAAKTLLALGVG